MVARMVSNFVIIMKITVPSGMRLVNFKTCLVKQLKQPHRTKRSSQKGFRETPNSIDHQIGVPHLMTVPTCLCCQSLNQMLSNAPTASLHKLSLLLNSKPQPGSVGTMGPGPIVHRHPVIPIAYYAKLIRMIG